MTTELLQRVKHIEGMLAHLIEANALEMEDQARWKNDFDAQTRSFERSLDDIEAFRKDLDSSTRRAT